MRTTIYKAQAYTVQHNDYDQYLTITINAVKHLTIVTRFIVHLRLILCSSSISVGIQKLLNIFPEGEKKKSLLPVASGTPTASLPLAVMDNLPFNKCLSSVHPAGVVFYYQQVEHSLIHVQ